VENDLEADLDAVSSIDAVPKILEVVCRSTGLGFAAVARVTEQRWVACAVRDEISLGLRPGGELKIETTLCNEVRHSGRLVVFDDASEETAFSDHPTPKMYGFRSYISVPIRRTDGSFFGTLCALDPGPARVKAPETIGMFNLFADLIGFHLDTRERLRVSETALLDERETAQLREQFIAVLGHDLRNPLNAIRGAAEMLPELVPGEQAAQVAGLIRRSADRMAGLIDVVMDFARVRLGRGLFLTRVADADVEGVLKQVIDEARSAWPGRTVVCEYDLGCKVACDEARLAQMLSNLLANALTHGDPEGPVTVRARTNDGGFELSVSNLGRPIPPETARQLFRPFSRDAGRPGQQGLGLGLYIASEIARAHGGTLDVESTPEETRFTFRMPLAPA